jgi:hypothetical protein
MGHLMPHVIIRLETDPSTHKKTVIISYESDADALPMEHEDEHRRIVDKLIEGGALKASELGKIVIEREQEKPQKPGSVQTDPQVERESVKT